MSAMISDAVKAVAGPVKTLVVDRIQEYVKFVNTYEENMTNLVRELRVLCAKKLDLEAKVMREKADMRVMTRETGNWLRSLMDLIEKQEMKQLMKEEGVAEIVVKMMERGVLKKLWKEDREIFDIVVDVVKKKCNHQMVANGEVVDAEEDADYKKIVKIASDVMKDIADEFTEFIKGDDAAVAVVKLLNNVNLHNVDIEKLMKDGDEMALILSKAEGIIRKEVGLNYHDEEELLIPKHDVDVQLVNESFIKQKVGNLRKRMGSLMSFLDDENFKKGLPDGAKLGLEVMTALSHSSRSEQSVENSKPHRYCGYCVVRFEVKRRHHDMSERAVTMVEAIKSMIHECPQDPVTRSIRDNELEYIPGEFIEGLESREALLRKILIALKDDQVNIVGVYGMGGCGKTTLAKEIVYKRTSDLFDKRVMIEVSEAPNIKSIQNQIAGGIGLTLNDMHTVAQRARIVYNRLKVEKVLIIFDNIWKKLKLDEVGIPRVSNKDFYCKLLITTREERVCTDMDVHKANLFKVGLLNDREALNLFESHTEKKVGNGEFKSVTDRLLRKCGGLPLTIATTASALRGKNLSTWCRFAETSEKPMSSQVSSEYRETFSILETSFKLIDTEEKRILLFLACLSPLDLAITMDDLMRYGIGLDLFQRVNSLSEATEQANMWANELISSSFLLKGASDGEVKIHDLIRASAISFFDKGKDRMTLVESIPRWMCKEMFEKFTAISLMSGHDFSRLSGVKAPMLEILLLKGDVSMTTLNSDFFGEMKNLKVLSLSNLNFDQGLPESMGELERLQTLHLHHCKLKDIKLIGKLMNLLVLSLRESSLEELAVEIGELCKLRLLDIGGCKGMKRIPANILSRLSHLEGLYMLNCFDRWAVPSYIEVFADGSKQTSASELDTLYHLNILEMDISDFNQLLTLNNGQLTEQLCKFRVRVGNTYAASYEGVSGCPYVLELVETYGYPTNWLSGLLKKTEYLVLRNNGSFTEIILRELAEDGFKGLKHLVVKYSTSVKFIISSNEQDESIAFANLEILNLGSLYSLEKICDGKVPAGSFSNLRRLNLSYLRNLRCGLPPTSVSLNLSEISIKACQHLKFIVYKDASVAKDKTDVDLFPRLKSLNLCNVTRLSSVLEQSSNEVVPLFNAESKYPSLETLDLCYNETIQTLWSSASYISGFQNLKTLDIVECSELRSLGSPSMFATLVQLEELKVSECDKLKEVIIKETEGDKVREQVINFPSLKHLSLVDLRIIERFYGGGFKLDFPNLISLRLSNACNLTNFDGLDNPLTFFSDKIKFPRLEELDVQSVSNEVVSLWNWSSLDVEGLSEHNSTSLNPVPNLQKLTFGQVQGLTSIPHYISHKLSHLQVNKFDYIKSLFSISAVNEEVLWRCSHVPNLESLSVGGCDSLEQLFDNEDGDVAVTLYKRLIGITLDTLPKLKILPLHLLENIHTLTITNLSWKYVFPANLFIKGREQLQQLECLKIRECYEMKVIFKNEVVGDENERVYGFPRLKILDLYDLEITKFATEPNTELHLPSLESIQMAHCSRLQSCWLGRVIVPKLKEVVLERCGMEYFLSEKMNKNQELPSLESVNIRFCEKMLAFSSKPFVAPKLHHVAIYHCSEIMWFVHGDPKQDEILELPSLEGVSIMYSAHMQSFSSGGIKAPNLYEFEHGDRNYSRCGNEELQRMLVNLHKNWTREESENDDNDESDGEIEEQQTEGSQDEQNEDGDDELEELRTENNDKSQKEHSMEGDKELEELRTEGNVKSQKEQGMEGDKELEELPTKRND